MEYPPSKIFLISLLVMPYCFPLLYYTYENEQIFHIIYTNKYVVYTMQYLIIIYIITENFI